MSFGGGKTPQSDDTLRHLVSSKRGVTGLGGGKTPQSDDTLRHLVSSKRGVKGLDDLKRPKVMIPRATQYHQKEGFKPRQPQNTPK